MYCCNLAAAVGIVLPVLWFLCIVATQLGFFGLVVGKIPHIAACAWCMHW